MRELNRFPESASEVGAIIERLVNAAEEFCRIEKEIDESLGVDEIPGVIRGIARTVFNSLASVLILVRNGCGTDAWKIARTMLEAAENIHYLATNPELLQDYIDFQWVKKKRWHNYVLKVARNHDATLDPAEIREGEKVEAKYDRVKLRFTDTTTHNSLCPNCRETTQRISKRVRHSWCKPNRTSDVRAGCQEDR